MNKETKQLVIQPIDLASSNKIRQWIPWITGVLSLSIYCLTLAPTVTAEDSGEFICAAYDWGVPHPPGYPLWTLLTGIFIRIVPIGSIAYRANLFSAVLASISAGIVSHILLRSFKLRAVSGLAGGILFACGLHLWSQSVITEVYSLHVLLTCILTVLALRWIESKQERYLYLISLFTGLALANHNLTVLLIPLEFLLVLIVRPQVFLSLRIVGLCLLLLGVGLLPYAYLPIAASHKPYLNWGNPDSWSNFLVHVLRKQYSDESMKAAHTLHRSLGHIGVLAHWTIQQYTPVAIPFLLGGMVYLFRNHRGFFYGTLAFYLMHTLVFGELLNFNFQRQDLFCDRVFILPAYLVTAIWTVLGCEKVGQELSCRFSRFKWAPAIPYVPILVVLVTTFTANYSPNNMRNYYYAKDHADNILNSLDANAILIPSGDHNTFPLLYRHHVEGVRPDITIADKYGYIEYDLYSSMPNAPKRIRTRQEREAIEAYLIQSSGRSVYFTVKPRLDLVPDYTAISHGMLFRISKKDLHPIQSALPQYQYQNLQGMNTVLDYMASVILSDYYFSQAANAFRQKQIEEGLTFIDKAAQLSEGLKEEMNNLGTLLAEFQQDEQAIGFYEKAARLDKKYLTPRWNLAYLFKARGDVVHAIQVFNDLGNIDPQDFRVFGELGFLLRQYGNIELAIQNWGKSLALNPDQSQIIQAIAALTVKNNPAEVPIPQPELPDVKPPQPFSPAPSDHEPD
jgi:tetratricopeptide (TPR) repeat protein